MWRKIVFKYELNNTIISEKIKENTFLNETMKGSIQANEDTKNKHINNRMI